MRNLYYFFTLALLGCFFISCDNDKTDVVKVNPSVGSNKVLFIYMAADNSLGYPGNAFDVLNLNNMVQAATRYNMGDEHNNRIIVFHDGYKAEPQLLEIKPGANGEGEKKVLKTYGELDSASPETFAMILEDLEEFTNPSRDKYGLIMWSHGSGWLPGIISIRSATSTNGETSTSGEFVPVKVVGQDDEGVRTFFELDEFIEVLPTGMFEYVIFDECYMGNIEIAYVLRDKVRYMIASPSVVIGSGFPYDHVVPYLFYDKIPFGKGGVAESFYNYYNTHPNAGSSPNSQWRTATIGVLDCKAVSDEFIEVMSQIVTRFSSVIPEIRSSHVQYYDVVTDGGKPISSGDGFFDLGSFVDYLFYTEEQKNDPLYISFRRHLESIVQYKAITEYVYSYPKKSDQFCGVTTFIPRNSIANAINNAYTRTGWYQAVYN